MLSGGRLPSTAGQQIRRFIKKTFKTFSHADETWSRGRPAGHGRKHLRSYFFFYGQAMMFNCCEPSRPSVRGPSIKKQEGSSPDERLDLRNDFLRPCGVGIGLRYDSDRQIIAVGSLAPGGPAHKSAIEKDDILLKIDGKDVRSSKPSQLGPYLTGPKGSIVKLDLLRLVDGTEYPFTVALVRNWSASSGSSRVSVSSRLVWCFFHKRILVLLRSSSV